MGFSSVRMCATIPDMARVNVGRRITQYLPAVGFVADYGERRLPLICWAVDDSGDLFGLVFWKGEVRAAEDLSSRWFGGAFKGYEGIAA